ncbi:MAG: competence protein ComK [Bacilli bacterium]
MDKNTLYFHTSNHVIEHRCDKTIKHSVSFGFLLSQACLQELTTLSGRIEAMKTLFGLKYNIPVYINEHVLLFKVMDNNKQYWINYYKVKRFKQCESKTVILLENNETINVSKSLRAFQKLWKTLGLISEYRQ